jgi:hypothetical protein
MLHFCFNYLLCCADRLLYGSTREGQSTDERAWGTRPSGRAKLTEDYLKRARYPPLGTLDLSSLTVEEARELDAKGGPMPSYESSMRNLAKGRSKWRPPRPWRSSQESRMIRRFAFQWFTGGNRPSGREWARKLGISHT